ncbi:TRAP transporter small permease [Phaeobacter gallaeciensis]|jgi:TRAP-type C4-dicarboxylate transport system permease small subunit|uniref:TRAP transporter small permease n=1 Tax=Phaeobacter gallaeciensis TaxID=60890 RepID=UPI00238025B0|nr:TRAP transporter small permease [Phaeobacter gallaeciensis]MDE4276787.1 TRAP transporter small permease [Phaeobacter gallaeciensis]MDE4302011.1 TRAP transporter small permease [Phaeobacter gallaeciensis]MDE5187211.1 TRAP transporter small permease [Phaeobacter gallaeciensis]
MRYLGRGVAGLSRWATIMGGLSIALMMAHVTADVAMRYIFNRPLSGTLTVVTYYYMIFATFLPLGLAERRRAHISVEVLTDMMPGRVQHHLRGWIMLPTAVVMGLVSWRTFDAAIKAWDLGATQVQGATRILVWPAYFALPLGTGLMALILLIRFASYLTGRPDGLDESEASR